MQKLETPPLSLSLSLSLCLSLSLSLSLSLTHTHTHTPKKDLTRLLLPGWTLQLHFHVLSNMLVTGVVNSVKKGLESTAGTCNMS